MVLFDCIRCTKQNNPNVVIAFPVFREINNKNHRNQCCLYLGDNKYFGQSYCLYVVLRPPGAYFTHNET